MAQEVIPARPLERFRRRIEELRRRIRERVPLRPEKGVTGEIEIGKGALIELARERVDELVARVAELRPRVIPLVEEFRPGERIKKLMKGQGTATGEYPLAEEEKERERPTATYPLYE